MKGKKRLFKFVSQLVLLCFLMVNLQQVVFAGMVSTTDIIDSKVAQVEKQRIYELLARDDVRGKLVEYGVDPEDAVNRVANMTDEEARLFAQNMQELPAGGTDVLGVLLIVFLVLLFTDIMGYTDIFPFVKKTAK
ncbi:MAG: PA2779 family protein [Gammaproteobacteria bacterium]